MGIQNDKNKVRMDSQKSSISKQFMITSLIVTSVFYLFFFIFNYYNDSWFKHSQVQYQDKIKEEFSKNIFIVAKISDQQMSMQEQLIKNELQAISDRINDQYEGIYSFKVQPSYTYQEVKSCKNKKIGNSLFSQLSQFYNMFQGSNCHREEEKTYDKYRMKYYNFQEVFYRRSCLTGIEQVEGWEQMFSNQSKQFIQNTDHLDYDFTDLFQNKQTASFIKRLVLVYVNENSKEMVTRIYPCQQYIVQSYDKYIEDKKKEYNEIKQMFDDKHITSQDTIFYGPSVIMHVDADTNKSESEKIISYNKPIIIDGKFKGILQAQVDPNQIFQQKINQIDRIYNSTISILINPQTQELMAHSYSNYFNKDISASTKYYEVPELVGLDEKTFEYLKDNRTDLQKNETKILNQFGIMKDYYWTKKVRQNRILLIYVDKNEIEQVQDQQTKIFYGVSHLTNNLTFTLIILGWSIQFYFTFQATLMIQKPLKKILKAAESFGRKSKNEQEYQKKQKSMEKFKELLKYESKDKLLGELLRVVKKLINMIINRQDLSETQIHREISTYHINYLKDEYSDSILQNMKVDWDKIKEQVKDEEGTDYDFLKENEFME